METSKRTILSIDPSSSCTGYAVLDRGMKLLDAGRLRGKSGTDAPARVMAMRQDLIELLDEHKPSVVLVEIPVDKQYTRQEGKKSGMAVWAGAAWALWMVCIDWAQRHNEQQEFLAGFAWDESKRTYVHQVSNTLWTSDIKQSKAMRQAGIGILYKGQYDSKLDKGGDVSDAIMIARWWIEKRCRDDIMRQVAKGCAGAGGRSRGRGKQADPDQR